VGGLDPPPLARPCFCFLCCRCRWVCSLGCSTTYCMVSDPSSPAGVSGAAAQEQLPQPERCDRCRYIQTAGPSSDSKALRAPSPTQLPLLRVGEYRMATRGGTRTQTAAAEAREGRDADVEGGPAEFSKEQVLLLLARVEQLQRVQDTARVVERLSDPRRLEPPATSKFPVPAATLAALPASMHANNLPPCRRPPLRAHSSIACSPLAVASRAPFTMRPRSTWLRLVWWSSCRRTCRPSSTCCPRCWTARRRQVVGGAGHKPVLRELAVLHAGGAPLVHRD
jgi:hypothetical protein